MATIIKLGIALVLLVACAQAGMAAFKGYKFEDTVHEAMLFAPAATDAELVERIKEIAEEEDVPLDPANISVRRVRSDIIVEMTYTETVRLIPGVYSKPWTFTPSTSVRSLRAQPARPPVRR